MVTLVALGWGIVVFGIGFDRSPASEVRRRARALAGPCRSRRSRRQRRVGTQLAARLVRDLADRRRRRRIDRRVVVQLPVAIDLLGVAAGAGCTPHAALHVAAEWAPPDIAGLLSSWVRSVALGRGFVAAGADLADRHDVVRPLFEALADTGRLGIPLRPALERLATEARAGVRRRAEIRARTVPVRLLFPLVFLVLPAFGLITVVPAVLAGLRGG